MEAIDRQQSAFILSRIMDDLVMNGFDLEVSVRMRLLIMCYSSLAEFVVWSEYFDDELLPEDFSSPQIFVSWIRNVIRSIEAELALSLDPDTLNHHLFSCRALFEERCASIRLLFSNIFH